jgi:hypothetical protein
VVVDWEGVGAGADGREGEDSCSAGDLFCVGVNEVAFG